MTVYTQAGRRLMLKTPLEDDALLLTSFSGTEQLSRLYTYRLEMLSENAAIDPADLVGRNVTFGIRLPDDSVRYYNGFVARFAAHGRGDRLALYSAEVVPWLWFLTLTAKCRIFQKLSVPEIIQKVFGALNFADFETSQISGSHPKWEYCVQYRESDFNFVSRLMEHEGIFYYFRHENGKHTLVLADSASGYEEAPEQEARLAHNLNSPQPKDNLTAWEHRLEFRPGKYTHTDYNFTIPSTNLLTSSSSVIKLPNANKLEIYDYPGEYENRGDGESEARLRMEEQEVPHDVVEGQSKCRTFSPGLKFKVAEHHIQSEEGKGYVLVTVQHQAVQPGSYLTGEAAKPLDYTNRFTAIPDSVAFRPPRLTPKPLVHGSQTAVVVGPAGEEIYTNEYGQVKVQFHWDREGQKNENSSCWVRVAQASAGNNWGIVFLPRVGQEVIVSFLEGDPDRPIITGCVYNADEKPPYALPDNKTMSAIKSNSSKGSQGFNEIRFEDKKGEEQIFIHGEKNQDIRIKNDVYEWVGHDTHLVVVNDQIEEIQHDRHEKIKNDHIEEIGRDHHLAVKGKEAIQVDQSHSFTVKGDVIEVFKVNHSEETTEKYFLKADTIVIEALTHITIKVGKTFIALEASGLSIGTKGTIDLESTGETKIKGTAGLKMEGTGGAELKGATLKLKGDGTAELASPMTTVKGDGMMTVKGGIVMIN
ncbi:MAG: type VI secretion system tip protein VgrG [Planctomycetota bacterium]|nr:type VI secretion system tip protein VgrG [Planctomycetota bacterium]